MRCRMVFSLLHVHSCSKPAYFYFTFSLPDGPFNVNVQELTANAARGASPRKRSADAHIQWEAREQGCCMVVGQVQVRGGTAVRRLSPSVRRMRSLPHTAWGQSDRRCCHHPWHGHFCV